MHVPRGHWLSSAQKFTNDKALYTIFTEGLIEMTILD